MTPRKVPLYYGINAYFGDFNEKYFISMSSFIFGRVFLYL